MNVSSDEGHHSEYTVKQIKASLDLDLYLKPGHLQWNHYLCQVPGVVIHILSDGLAFKEQEEPKGVATLRW